MYTEKTMQRCYIHTYIFYPTLHILAYTHALSAHLNIALCLSSSMLNHTLLSGLCSSEKLTPVMFSVCC